MVEDQGEGEFPWGFEIPELLLVVGKKSRVGFGKRGAFLLYCFLLTVFVKILKGLKEI